MAWTKNILNGAVILRTLIGIFNQQANTGAGGDAVEHAGKDFHLIRLTTLRGVTRGSRTTSVEIVLQISFCQRNTRRNTINDTAERQPV